MCSLCRTREREERSTHTGFLIASVEMLIIFCFFHFEMPSEKNAAIRQTLEWKKKQKKKQMSGFSDYKRLSLAGNNFKAAAFSAEGTRLQWKVWYPLSLQNHNGALFENDRCTNEALSFPKYGKPWSFTRLCF